MTFESNQNLELLKNAEMIKESFQNDCNDYFLLVNNQLKIISFNLSAANFFNSLNQKEFQTGKKVFEYLSLLQFTPLKEMLQKAKDGLTLRQEILLPNPSGKEVWIRFTVSPSYNNKKEIIGISCIGCNVHKEKTQEEKINLQNDVLRQIAQMYSHQVRHPLTNIMAIIDLIRCDDFEMTKKYLGFLETASKELDYVIRKVVLASAKAA